jgi:DNA-binding LacI/PurR family transcriptional regulator
VHGGQSDVQKQIFVVSLPYTAIFAATDSLALRRVCRRPRSGHPHSGRLSLMGFDNILYADLPRIRLTTIEQPKKTMATASPWIFCLKKSTTKPRLFPSHPDGEH